jgi:hypothetical protein
VYRAAIVERGEGVGVGVGVGEGEGVQAANEKKRVWWERSDCVVNVYLSQPESREELPYLKYLR